MAPELDTSSWPPTWKGPNFKAPRGSATVAKEKAAVKETDAEKMIKEDVRFRDGKKCRCPFKHKCRFGLEVIHVKDRSTGGEFVTTNLWLGCGWIHRKGSPSIHGKDFDIVPLTNKGMDGPVEWWRVIYPEGGGPSVRTLIAVESSPGVLAK